LLEPANPGGAWKEAVKWVFSYVEERTF